MVGGELPRTLEDKVGELDNILFEFQQLNRPIVPIHTCLSGILDALEDMYVTGTLDIPLVDDETRRFRNLSEELSDLRIRKEEVQSVISEGPPPGSFYQLHKIRAQIKQVKDELEPMARPMLPFVTEDEIEVEDWFTDEELEYEE